MEILLVIGSGAQIYREYALSAIAKKYAIVLINSSPLSWQKPYVIDYAQVPLTDEALVFEVVHQMAQKYSFSGVFTYDEPSLEIANLVAHNLHLPHNNRETIRACRDKSLMRHYWQQKAIPSAQSYLSFSLEETRKAAVEIGFPVVLKPRSMGASIGVIRVDNLQELTDAYKVAATTHPMFKKVPPGILVEEYLDGPEISVESAIIEGQVHIIAITRKRLGLAPYFEEIGHVISSDEILDADKEIRNVVIAAHQALNITRGITHAEVRLTAGGPRMIEINARIAGDFIPLLVSLTHNIDLSVVGADIATGKIPSLQLYPMGTAAIHFIYPSQEIKVSSLDVDPILSRFTWINRVEWLARPGDELLLPPHSYVSRLGFIVVTGRSVMECDEYIESALKLLHVNGISLKHD